MLRNFIHYQRSDAIARVMTGTNTKDPAVGAGLGIKIRTYTDKVKTKPVLPQ